MVTWHSGKVENPTTFRASFSASSRVSMALVREQHVDLPEPRGGAAVADGVDLGRLALGISREAELPPVGRAGGAVAGLPEVGRTALVGDARNHAALLAALDFPKSVAAELEVVALLVDGIIAGAIDQDAVVDAGDQAFKRGLPRAGFEPDIGHALEGHGGPGIGLAAAVRFLVAHQVRLFAGGLVVAENALFDDGELGGLDAIVVIARGAEGARRSAVADEGAMFTRDALADLVRRDVAGAGVVGFVAQGAVKLGGVRHALVNRQAEMAGQQQQVLL